MRAIVTKFGKVYYDDDSYYLERIYDDMADLIEDEKVIKSNIRKADFKIKKSEWQMKAYPFAMKEDKLRFILKLDLEYEK
ncbi:hypothetical protein [Acinetobacter sp.]|uniref:hypothetical protein n=1 Tax=Acinetobacter sp. TaxID=472 RepID=UPI000C093DBC|nr:hypothetical protein [Acinetobacter sp.]MAK30733.1 hypothetical protein [Acinetobacter sp.]|tara:strand:+ start:2832 stop:3071 length:240 start_codon:yes stop_codon:yes gene_type:complete